MAIVNNFVADDYNTGLGDCCEGGCSSFLDAWCCTYCQVSAQYNMLTNRQKGVNGLMAAGLCCLDAWLTCGCALHFFAVHTRVLARKELNVKKETTCEMYMKGCFCTCCSVGQVYRELSIRHLWPGGVCVEGPYRKVSVTAPQPILGMGGDVEMQLYPSPQNNNNATGNGYPTAAAGAAPSVANGYPPVTTTSTNGYPSYHNQLAYNYNHGSLPPQQQATAAQQQVPPPQYGSQPHQQEYGGQPQMYHSNHQPLYGAPAGAVHSYGAPPPPPHPGQPSAPPGYGQPQPVYGYQGQAPTPGPKTAS